VLFVKPPVEAYRDPSLEDTFYLESHGAKTYAEYNYLGGGLGARAKLGHFHAVLKLCREMFGQANVVDFGCADGVFLPSLSKYFNHVAGVDIREEFIRVSRVMAENMGLANVELHCNKDMSREQLKKRMSGGPYSLAFIREVLEHVGDPATMHEDKVALVQDVFSLLEPRGRVVISAPKMVGLAFLVQRIGLAALRLKREPVTFRELMRATFLKDTDALESRWIHDHIGFNHLKMERSLEKEFRIVKRTGTFFQAIYLLERQR